MCGEARPALPPAPPAGRGAGPWGTPPADLRADPGPDPPGAGVGRGRRALPRDGRYDAVSGAAGAGPGVPRGRGRRARRRAGDRAAGAEPRKWREVPGGWAGEALSVHGRGRVHPALPSGQALPGEHLGAEPHLPGGAGRGRVPARSLDPVPGTGKESDARGLRGGVGGALVWGRGPGVQPEARRGRGSAVFPPLPPDLRAASGTPSPTLHSHGFRVSLASSPEVDGGPPAFPARTQPSSR